LPAPDGYTNIGDAIALATENLPPASLDQTRVEILLTDGKANCYPIHGVIQCNNNYQTQAEQYAIGKANTAKQAGIIIFTIGLGNDINETFLKQVATDDTMYFHAPNASDLEAIYDQIAEIINSYNISQNAWQEE
jgi:Mg-chelatase subunit ChlD